jgi:hypothetical protein
MASIKMVSEDHAVGRVKEHSVQGVRVAPSSSITSGSEPKASALHVKQGPPPTARENLCLR